MTSNDYKAAMLDFFAEYGRAKHDPKCQAMVKPWWEKFKHIRIEVFRSLLESLRRKHPDYLPNLNQAKALLDSITPAEPPKPLQEEPPDERTFQLALAAWDEAIIEFERRNQPKLLATAKKMREVCLENERRRKLGQKPLRYNFKDVIRAL